MKPYAKPKARDAKRDGWTKRESIIALVSMAVTAVSAMASAGSAIFTYQQVRIINRERMTPYRAILYSAKLDAYKAIASSYENFLHEQWLAETKIYNTLSDSQEIDYEALKRFEDAQKAFKDTLLIHEVVWPKPIAKHLERMRYGVADSGHCIGSIEQSISTHSPPAQVIRFAMKDCDVHIGWSAGGANPGPPNPVIQAMRDNLEADQLQAIDNK